MTCYGFRFVILFLGALAVTTGGCRRAEFTFVPVEGTVTKGGRPLRDVEVVFFADPEAGTVGPRATGRTDESGHYRLRTDHGDDGTVVGKHRVVILDTEVRKKQLLRTFRGPQQREAIQRLTPENAKHLQDQLKTVANAPRVPSLYGSINETPLRAEVSHEVRVFDIVIP